MNTILLKAGCIFLFGFIFFQAFQKSSPSPNQLSSTEALEIIEQKATFVAGVNTSLAANPNDYSFRLKAKN